MSDKFILLVKFSKLVSYLQQCVVCIQGSFYYYCWASRLKR